MTRHLVRLAVPVVLGLVVAGYAARADYARLIPTDIEPDGAMTRPTPPDIASDEALRKALSDAEKRLIETRMEYLEASPEVRALQRQVGRLRARLIRRQNEAPPLPPVPRQQAPTSLFQFVWH